MAVDSKNLTSRISTNIYEVGDITLGVSYADNKNLISRITSLKTSLTNLVSRITSLKVTSENLVCRLNVYYITSSTNLISRLTSLLTNSSNLVARVTSRVVTNRDLVCRLSVYYIPSSVNLVSRLISLKATAKNLVARLSVYFIPSYTNLVCRLNVYYIVNTKNLVSRITVNYLDDCMWGEESPASGIQSIPWSDCTDGAGSPPFVVGDADWGKVKVLSGEVAHTTVKDLGYVGAKLITLATDTYESGSGTGELYIRGQDTTFAIDAGTPVWTQYSAPIRKTWKFLQLKITKA